jgi:hypothetical protein
MDWMDKTRSEAAQLIKDIPNAKQYSMFDMLTVDPKYWPEMAKQIGLDANDLARVNEIDAWLGKLRDETGILIKNYLRDDLPRLRSAGYDLSRVYGPGTNKLPQQMSMFERLITTGKLDPRSRHIGSFMDTMMREGHSVKYMDKPLKELEK